MSEQRPVSALGCTRCPELEEENARLREELEQYKTPARHAQMQKFLERAEENKALKEANEIQAQSHEELLRGRNRVAWHLMMTLGFIVWHRHQPTGREADERLYAEVDKLKSKQLKTSSPSDPQSPGSDPGATSP